MNQFSYLTGSTERSEKSWFGCGRNISKPDSSKEELKNPFYENSVSRKNSQQTFVPKSLTEHFISGWTTLPTCLIYIYIICDIP